MMYRDVVAAILFAAASPLHIYATMMLMPPPTLVDMSPRATLLRAA